MRGAAVLCFQGDSGMSSTSNTLTTRQYRWTLLALVVIYLLMRLPQLTRLPVFIDEAAHIYWAQHNLSGGGPDGKWLSIVILAGFVRGLPLEPVVAARLGSVVLNLGGLLLIVALGRRIGTRRDALLAGALYVLLPYTLFYDRLALTDHAMNLFGLLVLHATLTLVRNPRPLTAGALTFALLGAVVSKLTGGLFVALPVLGVICLVPRRRWKDYILPLGVALGSMVLVLLALQLRSFGGDQFGEKLATGGFLAVLGANIPVLLGWAWALLTPPLAVVAVFAVGWAVVVERRREGYFLLAALGLVVGFFAVSASTLYPRYALFGLVPLLLLMARFLNAAVDRDGARLSGWMSGRSAIAAGLVLLAVWPLALDYQIVTNPRAAHLPEMIRWQYMDGWPSGTGVDALLAFLEAEAESAPSGVNVVRFPFLTSSYYSLNVLLHPTETLHLLTLDAYDPQPGDTIREYARQRRTLLILIMPREQGYFDTLGIAFDTLITGGDLIWEYPKPDGENSLQVWAFEP